MRVEANVTSGLLATDSSAVELVPLLQAEVRKLREMLTIQRIPVERERDLLESRVVVEMRKRVSELETQLAEREKLIDSLDLMRREELMEEEEELERLFLINGEGRDFRGEDPYNLYKNDVKYNNYNNDYDMNYNTYTNSDNHNHNNNNINHLNNNNGQSSGHSNHDSTDSRNTHTNYYHNTHSTNNTLHNENSIISAIHDRNSWDYSRINRERSRITGPGSPLKLKSNSSYQNNGQNNINNNNHSNNHHNSYSSSGHIQGQSRSMRSLFTSRNRSQEADTSVRNILNFNDTFSAPPPPPPLPSPTPTPTPTTVALVSAHAPAAVARSQPVVLLSEDAVDVSHPRVINLNQVSYLYFDKLNC